MKEILDKLKLQRHEKEIRLADNSLSFPELRDKLLNKVKRVKGKTKIILVKQNELII